jgi:hypothetical protein
LVEVDCSRMKWMRGLLERQRMKSGRCGSEKVLRGVTPGMMTWALEWCGLRRGPMFSFRFGL